MSTPRLSVRKLHFILSLALGMSFVPLPGRAYGGVIVGQGDETVHRGQTMVVMLRQGETSVLSVQTAYEGPPEDFAFVLPIPEGVAEDQVRTLPVELFTHLDRLSAPRLVEYWEQDPCPELEVRPGIDLSAAGRRGVAVPRGANYGVEVENEFEAGEYEVAILSAEDSRGLEGYLREADYNLPEETLEALAPYIARGSRFLVARVDVQNTDYREGRAVLSPLQVRYSSSEFSLPLPIGTREHELVILILGETRYEAANYANIFVPTNLVLQDRAGGNFPAFYRSLFDRVIASAPSALVTEYAWSAGSCDSCTASPLEDRDLVALGANIAGESGDSDWTLTRLHARYAPESFPEDILFRAAGSVWGGADHPNRRGELEGQRAEDVSGPNRFQARYVILHDYEADPRCARPDRGRWGGPPGRQQAGPIIESLPSSLTVAPQDDDALLLSETLAAGQHALVESPRTTRAQRIARTLQTLPSTHGGCAGCSAGGTSQAPFVGGLLALWLALPGRRNARNG